MPSMQRDVQRLLGRCLLRLQQYERLMKALVAHHELSGPAHALEAIQAARMESVSTDTLGTLVRRLAGFFTIDGEESTDALGNDPPDDAIFFSMRMRVCLTAEDYAPTLAELKELVSLRNRMVHHFVDAHDLRTEEGCRSAQRSLADAYACIDRHYGQLTVWAGHMDQARRAAAEWFQSEAFQDWLFNGIAPDGTVDWKAAGIVRALRAAAAPLAVDGWTSVAAAERWISEHHPDQRPARYGCRSWRQAIHESRLFDLAYREVDGLRTACYRAKAA